MVLQKKIPQLRFTEFVEDLEPTKLGLCCEYIKSGKSVKFEDGKYDLYGSTGIVGKTNLNLIKGEFLLVARVGANAGLLNLVKGEFGVSDNTLIVKLKNKLNSVFVKEFLVRYNINKLIYGSGQPLVTSSILKGIKINLPALPEQQKIASFLSAVDKRIELLQEKKNLLEDYKKGVMQQLFSQQIRFKDENGNNFPYWEENELSEIGYTFNGLSGKTKEDFGTGKPYVQYKQIFDSSKIRIENCGLVRINDSEKQSIIRYGDVFFTISSETPNEIGTASVLLEEVEEMYLNSFCFGLRVKKEKLIPSFGQYLFRSQTFRMKIIPLAQGSTRYNLSKSSFLKLKILLPSLKEQQKIASFLSAIDSKIETTKQQIDGVQIFKKGLLQQMFV